jgi:hypothetical protein
MPNLESRNALSRIVVSKLLAYSEGHFIPESTTHETPSIPQNQISDTPGQAKRATRTSD